MTARTIYHTPPEFFVIFMHHHHSEKLKVPIPFVNSLDGPFPMSWKLETAPRMSWEIGITKDKENYYMDKGWVDFYKQIPIKEVDLLVFTYIRPSCLYVKIFTRSTVRKKIQLADETNHIEAETSTTKAGSNHCTASTNPSFSCILTKSNWKLLTLPKRFWIDYVDHKSTSEVIVKVDNTSWTLGVTGDSDRISMRRGWRQFYTDNHLTTETSCHFELLDSKKLIFKATFNR